MLDISYYVDKCRFCYNESIDCEYFEVGNIILNRYSIVTHKEVRN